MTPLEVTHKMAMVDAVDTIVEIFWNLKRFTSWVNFSLRKKVWASKIFKQSITGLDALECSLSSKFLQRSCYIYNIYNARVYISFLWPSCFTWRCAGWEEYPHVISACIHKAISRLVFHHQVIPLASQIVFVVYNLYTTHTEKPCITGAVISSHLPGT